MLGQIPMRLMVKDPPYSLESNLKSCLNPCHLDGRPSLGVLFHPRIRPNEARSRFLETGSTAAEVTSSFHGSETLKHAADGCEILHQLVTSWSLMASNIIYQQSILVRDKSSTNWDRDNIIYPQTL